jgi:SpoVK/Ycf46/Vps4 family AAA+-type ATPase
MTAYYRKAVRQGRLDKKDSAVQRDTVAGILIIDSYVFFETLPVDREWNAWPTVSAFSFASKVWGHALVDGLLPVAWQEEAWDALVIHPDKKALLAAVIRKQQDVGSIDVIQGKGEGTTFLLYGPPGTGKTLTAEAMAEMLHRPLYVVSAGEMGTTPQDLESRLSDALQLCARWNCICLIDEADIFLERRSGNDILRNALVCVMLRELEYHPGVLFLTTNKVRGIDPAVQSRLTLALSYQPLDLSSRQKVWSTLLERAAGDLAHFDTHALAVPEINGRQIKNCVRLSSALALDKDEKLNQKLLQTTLDTVCAFHRDLCGDEELS